MTPPAGSDCDSYQSYLVSVSNSSDGQKIETTSCSYDDLIFDTSDAVETSLVADWDLTCDRWINLSALGATYMLGMLVGSFVMGLLSDKFGRMKALMLSVLLVSVAGFIGAFVNDPICKIRCFYHMTLLPD